MVLVYEAGYSGFWLARWLARHSVETFVVQPSSVPVDRRARRAKSDGIDAELLLRTLLAWLRGEPRVCSMVPIPTEADEDARRCVRERQDLLRDRGALVNGIAAILATLGIRGYNPLRRDRRQRLTSLRTSLGDVAVSHLRQFDAALAAHEPQTQTMLRARSRIIAISEALAQHAAYFDAPA